MGPTGEGAALARVVPVRVLRLAPGLIHGNLLGLVVSFSPRFDDDRPLTRVQVLLRPSPVRPPALPPHYLSNPQYILTALFFSSETNSALGSFTNAILSVIFATLSGIWLDRTSVPIKTRARGLFVAFTSLGLAGWIWLLVNQASSLTTIFFQLMRSAGLICVL